MSRRRKPPVRPAETGEPVEELEFDVWQFVRLMVAMEDGDRSAPAWRAWRDIWQSLDAELERLRKSDRAAFADKMMEQSVILEAVPVSWLPGIAGTLETLAKELDRAVRQARDKAVRADLHFEREGLRERAASIRALAKLDRGSG